MARPTDLKFTKSHEWVRVDGNAAVVGITDYAVEQLGDLAFLELPDVGRSVTAGESVGEVESTKTVSDLYSPLTGEIIEVNSAAAEALEPVTSSPFGDGWLIKLSIADPAELDGLLDAAGYEEHIEHEEAH